MKKLGFIIVLFLAGCAAQFDPNLAGPPPADYKAAVATHINNTFFDPYSLRDVSISDPIKEH